jgi:transposase InsO family protein
MRDRVILHKRTRPYTPRTNGKAERLHKRWTANGPAG